MANICFIPIAAAVFIIIRQERRVGLPAVNGGSADHLMLQSLLCRRVDAQPLPANTDLREYEGAYGTVLERYIVRCSESGLSIEKNGGTHACVYVFGGRSDFYPNASEDRGGSRRQFDNT